MSIRIKRKVLISKFTTFAVGGYAEYFVDVRDKEELLQAIKFAEEKALPIFVLGGGSNILVNDKRFIGLVLRYLGRELKSKEEKNYVLVWVEAGLPWDSLVKWSVRRNLQGIECLSGIPGTLGAAPIQNIGAYGQELKNVFIRLTAYDLVLKKFVVFSKKKCKFTYRGSIFKDPDKKGRYIITDLTLKLNKNQKPLLSYQSLLYYFNQKKLSNPTLQQVRRAVLNLRRRKLEDPRVSGNAGSFFKNPIVSRRFLDRLRRQYKDVPFNHVAKGKYKLFAGWLIEKAGWKGKGFGGASVSSKNALVIINKENKAKAEDIYTLSKKIVNDINKKFAIELEPEVQFVGFK